MTGPWPRWAVRAIAVAALFGPHPARGDDGPVVVEPGDLTRRPDLVGREVQVDDRLSRFQYHRETGFDQIFLTRAPEVAFEVPRPLRPTQNPSVVAVKVRGTLRHEDGRWWVDVRDFEPQPADIDRLNRGVATVSKLDSDARSAWARWAEQRGRAFHDDALLKRAREVEGDAIRAESDRPPGPVPSAHWLALSARARARQVPEPEPSAQAHRGFRAALAESKSAADLQALSEKIAGVFPAAKEVVSETIDLSRWEKPYAKAPADAYRAAPADVRPALDHRLWADAVQQSLERRAVENPGALLALSDEAARLLPDRPDLSKSFLEKGLGSSSAEVASLRQAEVEARAALYRDKLHQPEKARELYHAWLDDQKNHRLSARDAGGRISLAGQYEALLDDRATAIALLRDAAAIDPESAEVADAFRRRDFRKVNGEWVEGTKSRAAAAPGPNPPAPVAVADVSPPSTDRGRSGSLRGATPEEVRTRMGGRPNRMIRVASQGQLVDQWVYFGPRLDQYVNFLRRPGEPQPRVVSYYSLPHNPADLTP